MKAQCEEGSYYWNGKRDLIDMDSPCSTLYNNPALDFKRTLLMVIQKEAREITLKLSRETV